MGHNKSNGGAGSIRPDNWKHRKAWEQSMGKIVSLMVQFFSGEGGFVLLKWE